VGISRLLKGTPRAVPDTKRKIELCTPDVIDLPIINLQDAGRPFKIKVSTIRMVQHSPFTVKRIRTFTSKDLFNYVILSIRMG
jgi:hypothetical protein